MTIYSLEYSFSYLEPVCRSMSSSHCCFLTCIQISQEAGQVGWYTHLFQNFPQFIVIHTVKVFGIVNEAEIDVFLELSCFFHDPADVGNLISGSSAFSKTSLNIREFMVHVLLKSGLENFEHDFTSMWDECNCAVVWAFFSSAFLWDWIENWPFPVLWLLLIFPNLLAYWVQHFHSIIFQDLKQLNWNAITSTSFVRTDAFKGPLDFTFQDLIRGSKFLSLARRARFGPKVCPCAAHLAPFAAVVRTWQSVWSRPTNL